MQIPYLDGFLVKYLLGVLTVVCAVANLYPIFSVIFTGGVGKNGSTVAVSPVNNSNLLLNMQKWEQHGMRSGAETTYLLQNIYSFNTHSLPPCFLLNYVSPRVILDFDIPTSSHATFTMNFTCIYKIHCQLCHYIQPTGVFISHAQSHF